MQCLRSIHTYNHLLPIWALVVSDSIQDNGCCIPSYDQSW